MVIKHSNPYLIIFALWLLMFSASSQLMIISPILPQIGAELNIPESIQGTLITAYAIMLSIFALVMGPISDKIGRRRILMWGCGSMAFALFLHNFAFNYTSLLAARAIAGAAGGVLSGSAVSYVGDYFPYEKRGWANGWISTGIAAGQIIGIPLGTVLAEWFGFRGPFSLFAVIMYLAFMLIWLAVPQPNVRRVEGKLTLNRVIKNYGQMLLKPFILATAATFGLMYLGISLYIVYLPTWLKSTFDISGYEIASLFFAGGVATVLFGPPAGRLSDRIGRKILIINSCIGLSLVMAITTFVLIRFWVAYLLFFLTMVLVAARMSPFQALISEIVPDEQRGAMMSLTIALGQFGMGLGGALAGIAYTGYGYLSNTLLGATSVMLMSYIIWRFIPEPELKKENVTSETIIGTNAPAQKS
jgi:predicted MFS family arabinose efflux permease